MIDTKAPDSGSCQGLFLWVSIVLLKLIFYADDLTSRRTTPLRLQQTVVQ